MTFARSLALLADPLPHLHSSRKRPLTHSARTHARTHSLSPHAPTHARTGGETAGFRCWEGEIGRSIDRLIGVEGSSWLLHRIVL